MLNRNIFNHVTGCKQINSNNLFKNKVTDKVFAYELCVCVYVCMYVCMYVCIGIWH